MEGTLDSIKERAMTRESQVKDEPPRSYLRKGSNSRTRYDPK